MNKKSNRVIGLDIFRILSMCGIVGLHIMGNGGILKNTNINSYQYPILLFLYSIFYLSVNSFALLSGYLSIKKDNIKHQRIIELIAIIAFFILTETAVFYIFNINNIRSEGYKTLIKSLFPFGIGYYWYISCYILLFFMIPYINKLANNLKQSEYKKLIIVGFVLLSILPNIFIQTDFFRIDNGYSSLWLVYCYLVGGYIKRYPIKKTAKQCILRLIMAILGMVCFNYIWRLVGNKIFGHQVRESWMINYISPLNIYASIMALVIFSNINPKTKTIKIITSLSNASFAVYIFHDHYLFFDRILKDSFIPVTSFNILLEIAAILGGIITIYIIGYSLNCIRNIIFSLLRLNAITEKTGLYLDQRLEMKR